MAQCGRCHKMEKKLVKIQNGGPGFSDERSEAKQLHNEDKRAFALREREFGGNGNVQSKIIFGEPNKKVVPTCNSRSVYTHTHNTYTYTWTCTSTSTSTCTSCCSLKTQEVKGYVARVTVQRRRRRQHFSWFPLVFTAHSTQHTAHCTLHTAHCTAHTHSTVPTFHTHTHTHAHLKGEVRGISGEGSFRKWRIRPIEPSGSWFPPKFRRHF